MKTLKVAATSRATAVAGAIAWSVRQQKPVELAAIGAGAVNQATKAVAIARSYLAQEGLDISFAPSFSTITMANGETRTALTLRIAVIETGTDSEHLQAREAGSGATIPSA